MTQSFIPLLLILTLFTTQSWAEFSAQLKRDTIQEGESVQLILQSDGQASGEPDTTPLLQQFEILGNSRSSQVNIINGKMSARTSWNLTLSPKLIGTITLPALEFNGEHSAPLTLKVHPVETTSAEQGSPLFIESSVDLKTPYIQQMVHYRVQLFYRAKLAEGSLSDPQLENTLIQRLGEDREFTTKRNGVGYRVVERNYALFPQQSGRYTIPAPVLDARIIQSNNSSRGPRHPLNDLFNSGRFNSTQAVRIRGEAQTLNVRPRPPSQQRGEWLPAQALQLSEQWLPEEEEVEVGMPLSRTLIIEAEGVVGTMLPDLTPVADAGFKLYPEPATQESSATSEGMISKKVRKIAYIPTQAGSFTLPAVTLQWWNSRKNRMEVATLPSKTITVVAAVNTAVNSPENSIEQSEPIAPAAVVSPQSQLTPQSIPPTTQPPPTERITLWHWTTLLFALLWLLTLLLSWRRRRPQSPSEKPDLNSEPSSCKAAQKQLFAACNNNHPQQARAALLEWAACRWPDEPPTGLGALAQRLDHPILSALLSELDQALYQQGESSWDGAPLHQHLRQLPKEKRSKTDTSPLQPLYP
mgnify:FL=1